MSADPHIHDPHIHTTVSFFSDLGSGSDHVGIVRATLRELAPSVTLVDIAHDLAPFDVRGASLAVARAVPYLNSGVIIVGVDPGAGGSRRLVAVQVGAGIFLGPDNGVLAPGVALAGGAERAFTLDNVALHLDAPGSTFAVRDVLIPVAAHLCSGGDLTDIGSEIDVDSLLPGVLPLMREEDGDLVCEVIWVDRFGNCQINASRDDVENVWGAPMTRVRMTFGDTVRNVVIADSFAALGPGAVGLVVDSTGLLCIALDRASATAELGLGEGDQVTLAQGSDEPGMSIRVAPPTKRSST